MNGIESFLKTPLGKVVAVVGFLAAVGLCYYELHDTFLPNSTVQFANSPIFIDSETKKTFHVTLTDGMSIPVKSPFTGRMTGYKAELCYWTKDGHVAKEPTPVLMNDDIGVPGPTFCKDCGRLVVHHNPVATEDRRPPPTEAEWQLLHASGGNSN